MMVAWAMWLEAELALAASDVALVKVKLANAMAIGETLGLAPLTATCRISLAKCLWRLRDGAAAEVELADAIRSLQLLDMPGRLDEATALVGRGISGPARLKFQ